MERTNQPALKRGGASRKGIKVTVSDLIGFLSKFKNISNMETEHAFFKTMVSPGVYLNTIFKPASLGTVIQVAEDLMLPESLIKFYRGCNGAHLFVNALSIWGCLPKSYLLDRSQPFTLPPFNIRDANREMLSRRQDENLICVASYYYDGSSVCMHRSSQKVICFVGTGFTEELCKWNTLEEWLTSEITRLSLCFNDEGKCLVDEKHLLPTALPRI